MFVISRAAVATILSYISFVAVGASQFIDTRFRESFLLGGIVG